MNIQSDVGFVMVTNICHTTLLGIVFTCGCHVPIKWIYIWQNRIKIFLFLLPFIRMRFLSVGVKLSSIVITNKPLSLRHLMHNIHVKSDTAQAVLLHLEAKSSGIWPLVPLCQGKRNGKGTWLSSVSAQK